MKQYTLIVGHDFSLSNETDCDVQSDYMPGIWGIKTQKRAMEYSKKILTEGNEITRVTNYNNPKYNELANKFIKELGVKQPLFQEIGSVPASEPTEGKPSNLAQLKKYLSPEKKIRIINYGSSINTRETFVKKSQTQSIVLDKEGRNSWLDLGKATDWSFDKKGATQYFIN